MASGLVQALLSRSALLVIDLWATFASVPGPADSLRFREPGVDDLAAARRR
ncbi:MAG: hypothetical protein IPM00_07210 [Tetrasphaera sp.]|nr:hypothetical protein [Tetrasphaera sp.]